MRSEGVKRVCSNGSNTCRKKKEREKKEREKGDERKRKRERKEIREKERTKKEERERNSACFLSGADVSVEGL